MKILIFMCGEGLGHTTRCLSIGKEFMDAGHTVIFGAYGYSMEHIQKSGYNVLEIPSEIKLIGESGSLDMKDSIIKTIRNMQPLAYSKVSNIIKDENPDVVISDGYFLGGIASKRQKCKTFLILNQTNIGNFFKNRGTKVKVIGKVVERFAETIFSHVDRLIIPDFPPPFTICEHNLVFNNKTIGLVEFTGPLVRENFRQNFNNNSNNSKPQILSIISSFGYRKKLFENISEVAKTRQDIEFTLICGPEIAGDLKGYDNIKTLSSVIDVSPYIKNSDLIIVPGGHSTLMECMALGKPVISFPDMLHSEQENNAKKLNELVLGISLSYFTPAFMISDCINTILENESFKKNCRRMQKFTKELNGTKRFLELVEEG